MTASVAPIRDWLRTVDATHVFVEGPRIGKHRWSTRYALAQIKRLGPTDITVRDGEATITGYDPVTMQARTLAIAHSPTRRELDDLDRPVNTPCR